MSQRSPLVNMGTDWELVFKKSKNDSEDSVKLVEFYDDGKSVKVIVCGNIKHYKCKYLWDLTDIEDISSVKSKNK